MDRVEPRMDTDQENNHTTVHTNSEATNGNTNSEASNGNSNRDGEGPASDSMETDQSKPNSILSNPARFEALIKFGRSLQLMALELEQTRGKSEGNSKMLQDAFSLLAYSDPWDSPVGWQLDPAGRESVCAALNSAILESKNLPGRPPLEISIAHSKQLLKLMSTSELGACAFTDIDALLN